MYTPERTVRVIHAPQEYRSASTTTYLRNQWLPIQPTVQREIHSSLRAGRYDKDRSALCADLQRDPVTLFQCLKALPGYLPESGPLLDPLLPLREIPKAKLEEFLETVLSGRSVHRVGKGTTQQREEIVRSILSSSAAQALAGEEKDLPENLNVGVVAHLRNLGRMLVAWNYPRIFRRAHQRAKEEGIPLDTAIERALGVAPKALGFTIAREWGLHTEILRCIVFDSQREPDGASPFQRCGRVCGLSESYVDLVALADTDTRKSEQSRAIEERLSGEFGADFTAALRSTIATTLTSVRQRLNPERLANQREALARSATIKFSRSGDIGEDARKRMERFIAEHIEPQSVKAGLEEIINDLIPTLGFTQGCLYLLDRTQTYLVPVVQLGVRRPQGYPKVDVRKSGVIAESLFANHPVVQDGAYVNGEVQSHVTGAATLLGQEIVLSLAWTDRELLKGDPGALFWGIKACLGALGNIASIEKQ